MCGVKNSRPVLVAGNVLFNDSLNTFYLRLYGVGYMVKNHSDSERGNLLPLLHGLLFPISSKGYFYMKSSHRKDSTYHARRLLHQSWSTGWNEQL